MTSRWTCGKGRETLSSRCRHGCLAASSSQALLESCFFQRSYASTIPPWPAVISSCSIPVTVVVVWPKRRNPFRCFDVVDPGVGHSFIAKSPDSEILCLDFSVGLV